MSGFTFKTWRDPYGQCFSTCSKKEITLQPGLTILVGCNGSGKTTLLENIKEVVDKAKIPCYSYNNLHEGGMSSFSRCISSGDYGLGSLIFSSSEGEQISINVGQILNNISEFIETGLTPKRKEGMKWARILGGSDDSSYNESIRFITMDAVDSGLSVDNIVLLKQVLLDVVSHATNLGKEIYILVSANEFELARNMQCFDVAKGEYILFKDYDAYRNFIIRSRKRKDKRESDAVDRQNRKKEKELKMIRKYIIESVAKSKTKSWLYGFDKQQSIIKNVDDYSALRGYAISRSEIADLVDELIKNGEIECETS